MKPLEEFPEVPDGLENEIYHLYESIAEGKTGFSDHFRQKTGLGEDVARLLDLLVDQLYGTYETMKKLKSRGNHEERRAYEFNAFASASIGTFNPTGLVEGDHRKADQGTVELARSITGRVNDAVRGIGIISGKASMSERIGHDADASPENLIGEGIKALDEKLRFEAAMYAGMKAHYGVTVEIPS